MEFEQVISDFMQAQGLLPENGVVLLAVSGGADSTAMLHCLATLADRGQMRCRLVIGHVNHCLRSADSDADEGFVRDLALAGGMEFLVRRVDVAGLAAGEGLSVETAARQLRIKALLDMAGQSGCSAVATAHQADDNAETVLDRIMRGTGLRGLCGIRPKTLFSDMPFVRPMLEATRRQVVEYLRQTGLSWRTDNTNLDIRHRRNFIRHRLIPAMGIPRKAITESLLTLSRRAQDMDRTVQETTDGLWANGAIVNQESVQIRIDTFLQAGPEVRGEIMRRALGATGTGLGNITRGHYEKIMAMATGGQRSTVCLPENLVVSTSGQMLVFQHRQASELPRRGQAVCQVPGRAALDDRYILEATIVPYRARAMEAFVSSKDPFVEWLDLDRVRPPLLTGPRRPGERFWPFGLTGEKKVGKFITAQRLPEDQKSKIIIVRDTEKILWVAPLRINRPAAVTPDTNRILQLKLLDKRPASQ